MSVFALGTRFGLDLDFSKSSQVKSKPWGFHTSDFREKVKSNPSLALFTLVLSQYASITLPFQIVFNGGWSSMSLYIEKGLLGASLGPSLAQVKS